LTKEPFHVTVEKETKAIVAMRGCLTVIAELCGIAGFLLALYIFLKEYL